MFLFFLEHRRHSRLLIPPLPLVLTWNALELPQQITIITFSWTIHELLLDEILTQIPWWHTRALAYTHTNMLTHTHPNYTQTHPHYTQTHPHYTQTHPTSTHPPTHPNIHTHTHLRINTHAPQHHTQTRPKWTPTRTVILMLIISLPLSTTHTR